ncbi:hypothetical protein NQ176_g5590 [Zarea fungicola]|uniref:Uncharacterized protein n=1 Tax=Zarea fungicola TaxID=93591 RepID=A0ACC1N7P3_9HYPO|nr:hypothetical protein NQ176_g5590 [Lecanicillium fungicola]
MAPPRRVSCLNCIKSKRRCDIALPACQRCTLRGLVCEYTRRDVTKDRTAPLGNESADTQFASEDQQRRIPAQSAILGDRSEFTLPQHLAGDILPDYNNYWPVNDDGHESHTSLISIIMDTLVESIPRPETHVDRAITSGTIYNERTRYAARRLKLLPQEFCATGHNTFIHRSLYKEYTPEHIQDVLGSCALYSGKNEQTETLVFSTIGHKAANLVNNHIAFAAPVDLLSSTQALILYQIIRLFDGDIRQRAEAEAHESVLMSWTKELQQRTEPVLSTRPVASPNTQSSPLHESWGGWVFEESCRRTILMSYLLQGIYSFLKFGWDDVADDISRLSFTAQAALWNASSEMHWKESIRSFKPFQVTISRWDSHLEGAGVADLEEMGILMMALLKGTSVTSEWLGKDRVALWGLQ